MQELVPLFEEYSNKCLIIVDVQEPFKKWWIKNGKDNLVDDINKYCLQFPEVYQIWDDHQADIPSYEFNNQVKTLQKHFGVDKEDGELDNLEEIFDDPALSEIQKMLTSEILDTKGFKTKDGNYAILVNGSHKWFLPTRDFVHTLNKIQDEIVLVGGAEGECLKDIEVLLRLLDKKFTVNRELTYNAQDDVNESLSLKNMGFMNS